MGEKDLWKMDGGRCVEEEREDNDRKPQLLVPRALSRAAPTSGRGGWQPLPILAVPLSALATQTPVSVWQAWPCRSAPAWHSHHLRHPSRPPKALSQVGHPFHTACPTGDGWGPGLLLVPCMCLLSKPCPSDFLAHGTNWVWRRKERCHLCFHPYLVWLPHFNVLPLKKNQHSTC